MAKPFEAVQVSERVYWVGAVDWEIRNFHGYMTDRGTTYNAYLIMADTVTLVDTVKAPFREELMSRVASVVDPQRIDLVISNHSEMDHSGSLAAVVDAVSPSRVLASKMGVKALAAHFGPDLGVEAVEDGETLDLGGTALTFLESRMIHWPDSMLTYVSGDEVLISQDGFGMHLASSERFDDEIDAALLDHEAAKYYANILLPFSPLVTKLLASVKELDLPIRAIAPDHGPIWRAGIPRILESYGRWAAQRPTSKAVVVYDTMWHSTERMAHAVADGLASAGASVRVLPLGSSDRSEVAAEVLEAGALLVGTPTMNNQMFPSLADTLVYLKGLKPANLIGAVFGSYGWSGEAVNQVSDVLREMNVDLVCDGLRVQYVPTEEDLMACRRLGSDVGERLTAAAV